MSDLFDLTGKTIVVSGGAGLIGTAISRALASHGATTIVADVDAEAGKRLADDADNVVFQRCDVTDQDAVYDLVADVTSVHGGVDGLVNTSYPPAPNWSANYDDLTPEDWRAQVDAHLTTYFLNSKAAASAMMDGSKGGAIVNLGSIYGVQAPDFDVYEGTDMTSPVAYSAIKGGVINLSRYLASYLGEYGIRVNTLSPGGIFDDQQPVFVENYEERVPLERMGRPKDLQGAAVFLLSDASAYVTGHNLVVDGGWTIQ